MNATGSASGFITDGSNDAVEAILQHPFITELSSGSLPRANFTHFLVQDRIYIDSYSACLRILAEKAPTPATSEMLEQHAGGAIEAEAILHDRLLTLMGLDPAEVGTTPSPTTLSYTSYLLATCSRESFLVGLVSIFPCYLIYAQVAKHMSAQASPDPVYQAWFDNYSGDEYTEAVDEVRQVIDELGAKASPSELELLRGVYARGAQYEWMFWDAANIEERWPREFGFTPRERR